MDDVLFLETAGEVRAWFARHAGRATEVWFGFHRARTGRDGVTFAEASAVATAAGWTDGDRRVVDDASYAVRFTPATAPARPARRRTVDPAQWSGATFEALSADYEEQLRADAAAWSFFEAQPPRYRRAAIWWVMGAKHEETRQRRLAALIEGSAAGQQLTQLARLR